MADFKPSQAMIRGAANTPAVRAKLHSVAAKVAPDVDRELSSVRGDADVTLSDGVRSWRPYSRVSVDKDPSLDIVSAKQALARVAGRHNAPK